MPKPGERANRREVVWSPCPKESKDDGELIASFRVNTANRTKAEHNRLESVLNDQENGSHTASTPQSD